MRLIKHVLQLTCAAVIALFGMLFFVTVVDLVGDLRAFELPYLWRLLGYPGFALVAAGIGTVLWLTVESARVVINGGLLPVSKRKKAILAAILVGTAWVAEWMFMERPITVAALESMQGDSDYKRLQQNLLEFEDSGIDQYLPGASDPVSLRVMEERISANRAQFFERINVGAIIRSESTRAHVDPTLLFYWLYQTSFYGEAAAGPLPFVSQMSGETLRDLVQIHLPWWFIENPIREALVSETILQSLLGDSIGWKLRYALHKATLDVSTSPYSANIFSDIYLVMSRHEDSFRNELVEPTKDELDIALRRSFRRLRDDMHLNACSTTGIGPGESYQEFRDDLITFARAAFYKSLFDFSFATRVQALLARDVVDDLTEAVPANVWANVPHSQRMGIVAMGRDVYMPNVGKLSSVPYLLPELNCAPASFLLAEAASAGSALTSTTKFWRPPNAEDLWAAPFYSMRVFSEVWQAVYGERIADVRPTTTTDAAVRVIYRVGNPQAQSEERSAASNL